MSVKDYYFEHFSELAPEKKFHFATRMKNYLKTDYFDEYLKENRPSTELKSVLANNDFSRVAKYDLRKPFFEKYSGIYGVEATLFRIHHLLFEYSVDTRNEFKRLYSLQTLYNMADDLLADNEALKFLSTWAINTIYLTEEIFPRQRDVIRCLAEFANSIDAEALDATLFVYLCTHIIICDTGFYLKSLQESANLELLKRLLEKCAIAINTNIEIISLDACIEFLVCCNMAGVEYNEQKNMIKRICDDFKKDSPYLINYRRDKTVGSYFHTLNGAEHINALYIMSGLDAE